MRRFVCVLALALLAGCRTVPRVDETKENPLDTVAVQARCDSLRAALDPAVDTAAVKRYVAAWAARSRPLSSAERAALSDTVRAVYEVVETFYAGLPGNDLHPRVLALPTRPLPYNVVRDGSTTDTLRFVLNPTSPPFVLPGEPDTLSRRVVTNGSLDTFRPDVRRTDGKPVAFVTREDDAAANCYLSGLNAKANRTAQQRLDSLRFKEIPSKAADSLLLQHAFAEDDLRRARVERLGNLLPYMSHFGPPSFHQYPFAYGVTLDEPLRRTAVWSDDGRYLHLHFYLRTASGWQARGTRYIGEYIE